MLFTIFWIKKKSGRYELIQLVTHNTITYCFLEPADMHIDTSILNHDTKSKVSHKLKRRYAVQYEKLKTLPLFRVKK